jgi:hypothetical protein
MSAAGASRGFQGREYVGQELFLARTLTPADGGAQAQPSHNGYERPHAQNLQDQNAHVCLPPTSPGHTLDVAKQQPNRWPNDISLKPVIPDISKQIGTNGATQLETLVGKLYTDRELLTF